MSLKIIVLLYYIYIYNSEKNNSQFHTVVFYFSQRFSDFVIKGKSFQDCGQHTHALIGKSKDILKSTSDRSHTKINQL